MNAIPGTLTPPPIIEVSDVSKRYRLGKIGMTSLRDDLERIWHRLRAKPRGATPAPSRVAEFWALRGVSFAVQTGDVVGIVGRNGAGKSTLLKILSRITEPTSGEIRMRGRVASLLEVGTGFHPELSGRENIFLNGAMLGMRPAETRKKFDSILAFSEMEKFIDTPVKRYSSGMYVKLAFAVAAHLDPEILIIDEVLAVGDIAFQRKCVGRMSEVARSGRTVLFVSHNFGLVRSLCTRGVYLSQGQVSHVGPIDEVLHRCLKSYEVENARDLVNRKDRTGRGEVRLHHFEVLNASGAAGGIILPGESVEMRAQISAPRDRVSCLFRAFDSNNQLVATFNSSVRGARDELVAGPSARFSCRVDSLAVAPGRYRIDADVWVAGVKQDSIEGIDYLEVGDGELDGRMIRSSRDTGMVALPHRWSVGA